jgi:hypothetical protein
VKVVGKILVVLSTLAALLLLGRCLVKAPNTNISMPAREVHIRLSRDLQLDPALLAAITTVEIGHAAWVRIGDAPCIKQQSKPEMILVSAGAAPNEPSGQPALFAVQIKAPSTWELQFGFDEPGQIKLTASGASSPPIAMLRPPGQASVAGCGDVPEGAQITAEGENLELLLHLAPGDKHAPPLPILGNLPAKAVSGKLAKGQKQEADITRATHCDWDTRNSENEKFDVVAAGASAVDLTVDNLQLRDAFAELQFTWSHVTWQRGGDCGCRCLKELHDPGKDKE